MLRWIGRTIKSLILALAGPVAETPEALADIACSEVWFDESTSCDADNTGEGE